MANFGDLLGSILVGLAHARRMADEETAALAEYYKDHPLLEGMAIPRIRVPRMEIDLPVALDSFEAAEENIMETAAKVEEALNKKFNNLLKELDIEANADFKKQCFSIFKKHLRRQLRISSVRPKTFSQRRGSSEMVVRATENALSQISKELGSEYREKFSLDNEKIIRQELRHEAQVVALKKVGRAPKIEATIITSEVKERADNYNISRLRLIIKEEGVEWAVSGDEGGEIRRNLTPE